jgi:hypothetical protein
MSKPQGPGLYLARGKDRAGDDKEYVMELRGEPPFMYVAAAFGVGVDRPNFHQRLPYEETVGSDVEWVGRLEVEGRTRAREAHEPFRCIRKARGKWFACPDGPGVDVGPYSTPEEAWAWLTGEDA